MDLKGVRGETNIIKTHCPRMKKKGNNNRVGQE